MSFMRLNVFSVLTESACGWFGGDDDSSSEPVTPVIETPSVVVVDQGNLVMEVPAPLISNITGNESSLEGTGLRDYINIDPNPGIHTSARDELPS